MKRINLPWRRIDCSTCSQANNKLQLNHLIHLNLTILHLNRTKIRVLKIRANKIPVSRITTITEIGPKITTRAGRIITKDKTTTITITTIKDKTKAKIKIGRTDQSAPLAVFANHQSAACWYNPSGQNFKGITYNPEKHSYEAFLKRRADQNSGQNTGQGNTNNKNQSQDQGGRGQGGRTYKNNNANAITNTAGRQNTINSTPNIQPQPTSVAASLPISTSPPPATVDKQFMADFASHFWEELYKSNPANLVPLQHSGK